MTDLASKIEKLKLLCSRFQTNEFLTFIAGILLQLSRKQDNPYFKNLLSPMRQLFFLAQLNLHRVSKEEKVGFSQEEWEEMTALLHDIEMEYFFLLGFPKGRQENSEEVEKIGVAMSAYLNYHFNGPLAYQEQEIERIESIFKPFEKNIIDQWGLRIDDFINFFELVDKTINANLNRATNLMRNWQTFTAKCIEKGLLDPKTWINEAPEEMAAMIGFMRNPGHFIVCDTNKMNFDIVEKEKVLKIFDLFTSEPNPVSSILYYSDHYELLSKPFIKINEQQYLPFYAKQYLHACYEFLWKYVETTEKVKLLKHRNRWVEEKVARIFKKFLPKGTFFYENYTIDEGVSEQDLLILYKRTAIIVEVKSSTLRAPMRDAVKSFDKLKSDFKSSIQNAYDQTLRAEKAFKFSNSMSIKDFRKKELFRFNPKHYTTYSIIVTLDRFGSMQTNLADLLEIDSDNYPWCVNIDDLEAFLLTLSHETGKLQKLLTYLDFRKNFHGHLICADELELCGWFLKDPKTFKSSSSREETVTTLADLTQPIEQAYLKGMGFEKERHFEHKKHNQTGFLYQV